MSYVTQEVARVRVLFFGMSTNTLAPRGPRDLSKIRLLCTRIA